MFGKLVMAEWERSFLIRKELNCDCFVIMPNHLHSIIAIKEEGQKASGSKQPDKLIRNSHSISSFIASFKAVCSARIKKTGSFNFENIWQKNYYDHIIRSEEELNNIRKYIETNPLKWELDKYYAANKQMP